MKKLFQIIIFVLIVVPLFSKAQYITIPDPNLRQTFANAFPGCVNASQQLDTTCSAVLNATNFSTDLDITDWEGFQYLRNLQTLYIAEQNASYPVLPTTLRSLTMTGGAGIGLATLPALPEGLQNLYIESFSGVPMSLPSLPSTLTHLHCVATFITLLPALPAGLTYMNVNYNDLHSLPALPPNLDTLMCNDNTIVSLGTLPSTLKYLDCGGNYYITTLGPTLPAGLKYLDCSYNSLTSLPPLPSQLVVLKAWLNQLASLPPLSPTITTLDVSRNQLSVLPAPLPVSLTDFDCSENQIAVMPALPASLSRFICSFNQLTSLPSLPLTLQALACSDNHLTSIPAIPLTAYMSVFECQNNQLTGLPPLPYHLRSLWCQNNQLTSLPTLPPMFEELLCNNNQLSSLPALPQSVYRINCEHNNITCLPFLPLNMFELFMDSTIECIPNRPPDMYFMSPGTGYTQICNPTNNPDHCQLFPTMTGYVFNDDNGNGVQDMGEPYRAYQRVALADGSFTFSDENGYYIITADTIGTQVLSSPSSVYYTVVPSEYTYNFSSYDTLVANNFAMQPTAPFDSLDIFVSSLFGPARPGFPFAYIVNYENPGTTTVSPNIVLNYDNTRLIYDSSSNAAVVNMGSSLQLAAPAILPGTQSNFIAYFHVNVAAVIGDTLSANVHISANAYNDYDSTHQQIGGSYDPNDKSATPVLTPQQVAEGKYINYTIRFQNTGTDTAFNIVVTDTVSSLLQISSLQIIKSSHISRITAKDNVIYFEFNNVLLPDSNVNEPRSHGYVVFRMKPHPNVALNTDIPNKAAIYFDFNSPVITNTAITKIMNPTGPLPLKLVSFNVSRQTKNTANVYWNTMNEINVQGFIIETAQDGRNYTGIASQHAKGGSYNSYAMPVSIPADDIIYFRLKMTDMDGRVVYSEVVILKNSKTNAAFSFGQNPAKDVLTITLQDEALKNTTARIINMQGNVVQVFMLQNDVMNVNIQNLAAGTYILQTVKGSNSFVVRH